MNLEREIKELANKASELAFYATPSKYTCENDCSKERAEYYATLKLMNSKKEELYKLRKEEASKREEQETHKTFVNSFGEATKREITSLSYRRIQKRLENNVLRNLGI